MAKLRDLSGREVCLILAARGFTEACHRGRHIVMQKRERGSTVTVPVPDHHDLRINTLQSIIRQSDLKRNLFEIS